MDFSQIGGLFFILAACLFIVALKFLTSPTTAVRGNQLSALGMLLACIAAFAIGAEQDAKAAGYVLLAILIGGSFGAALASFTKMTSMPELVAAFNGFGGGSSLLLGLATVGIVTLATGEITAVTALALSISVLVGVVTFVGSAVAFMKLSEIISGRPFVLPQGRLINMTLLLISFVVAGSIMFVDPEHHLTVLLVAAGIAALAGILLVMAIGGADMPVVISMLNSYSGIAASAAGFVVQNTLLIVAGALVGASGAILTVVMCKAMNRSLGNVLFGALGAEVQSSGSAEEQGEVSPINVDDTFVQLEAAQSVIFVPGYGMAVAQAQNAVRELGQMLENNGTEVKYVIHPVAGRMPGHMNVLLAEANVDYDMLAEPDDINPTMEAVDIAVVVGANDVVNPQAKEDSSSPIYGMPIIEVDKARVVVVLKRSMASGFSGVSNSLFFKPNTRMLFGDARSTIEQLVAAFKG